MNSLPTALRSSDALATAVTWLAAARQPVCLVGRGAVHADALAGVHALCERLPRLLVATTPTAFGAVAEHHRRFVGTLGFCGSPRASEHVARADLVIVIGSRLLEQSSAAWLPRFRSGKVLRIDHDPSLANLANPEELYLCGDARDIVARLVAALPEPKEGAFTPELSSRDVPLVSRQTGASPGEESPLHPASVLECIARCAPAVTVCADAGNSMCWALEQLHPLQPHQLWVSTDWGTMGFALPAAIGLCLASKRPVIALVGDGAWAMAGGDLHTAVELGLPLIALALNDGGAGMVDAGCRSWFGADRVPSQRYRHPMQLWRLGEAFGAAAQAVQSVAELEQALGDALKRPTPTLIDIRVDPDAVPRAIGARVAGLRAPGAPGSSVFEDGKTTG